MSDMVDADELLKIFARVVAWVIAGFGAVCLVSFLLLNVIVDLIPR